MSNDPHAWITACSFAVAKDAKELLDEVAEQMDLAQDEIVIERFPPAVFGPAFDYDSYRDEVYIKARADVANMLVKRGVLKSAERIENGFRILADEEIVRRVHGLLKARLDGDLGIPSSNATVRDKFA